MSKAQKIIGGMQARNKEGSRILSSSSGIGHQAKVDPGFYGHTNSHAMLKGSSAIKHTAWEGKKC